jgi:hypothetical protein
MAAPGLLADDRSRVIQMMHGISTNIVDTIAMQFSYLLEKGNLVRCLAHNGSFYSRVGACGKPAAVRLVYLDFLVVSPFGIGKADPSRECQSSLFTLCSFWCCEGVIGFFRSSASRGSSWKL